MDFPILLSHLDDRYSIGQPSTRKQFLIALATVETAWAARQISSTTLSATRATFEQAIRLTWAEMRYGKGAPRDPASRAFWGRFAAAPQLETIPKALRTARLPPDGLAVQEQVIDWLRELVLLRMILGNLRKLPTHETND